MYKWKVLRKNKILDIIVALDEIEAMQVASRLLEGRMKNVHVERIGDAPNALWAPFLDELDDEDYKGASA